MEIGMAWNKLWPISLRAVRDCNIGEPNIVQPPKDQTEKAAQKSITYVGVKQHTIGNININRFLLNGWLNVKPTTMMIGEVW